MSQSPVRPDEIRQELDLVKKLSRLSKTSWSPTLRANAKAIEIRARELQAAEQRSSPRKARQAS